jgi:hypothetical protein
MDNWNQAKLSQYQEPKETKAKVDGAKDKKFRIGMLAFKRRMKKNLDKVEYRKQMKLLDMLTTSDMESETEEENFKIKIYKEFSQQRKQTETYKRAFGKVKQKLERLNRMPENDDIDSLVESAYDSAKAIEWG